MTPDAKTTPPRLSPRAAVVITLAAGTSLAACAQAGRQTTSSAAVPGVAALRPCAVAGYAGRALCAAVRVPEDRRRPAGRAIPLRVVVLPVETGDSAPDPVFYFAGGPGQAATDGLAGTTAEVALARRGRAVVLFDQRGTGGSSPLRCDLGDTEHSLVGWLTGAFPRDSLAGCRARYRAAGVDVARYTTEDAVEDAEAVRRALGYDRINLFGVSYGTRLVVEYLRRYPSHTRTATARGLEAAEARFPLEVARDAQHTLDQTLAACAADASCARAFPAATDDVTVAFTRLRARAPRLPLGAGGPGGADSITVTPEVLAGALLFALYDADGAAAIPLAMRAAARGEPGPLAMPGLLRAYWASRLLPAGMYLSVICSEYAPRLRQLPKDSQDAAARGTFLGETLVGNLLRACDVWLPGAAADAITRLRSDVPTLILTGDIDPVTPRRWGEALVQGLTHGRQVVLASTGHIPSMPRCAARLFAQFLDAGAVEGLDVSCAAESARPPFVTGTTAVDARIAIPAPTRADSAMHGSRSAAPPRATANVDGTWDLFWTTAKGPTQNGYLTIRQSGSELAAEVHGSGELEARGTVSGNDVLLTGRKIASFDIRAVARGDSLTGVLKVLSVERHFTGVRRR